MYMCVYVHMYVGKHAYVFSAVRKPELVCWPWSCSSCFLIQGFWFLNRLFGSPVWLGWLAREPQESSCFHLPRLSITSTRRHTYFLHGCESSNSSLHVRKFPDWSFSSALVVNCIVTLEPILHIKPFWCLSPSFYSFLLFPYLSSTNFWLTLYKNQF